MTKMFNSKLPALQQRLTLKCPGSFIIFTDKYDFVENIIKNGSEYGKLGNQLRRFRRSKQNSLTVCCPIITSKEYKSLLRVVYFVTVKNEI